MGLAGSRAKLSSGVLYIKINSEQQSGKTWFCYRLRARPGGFWLYIFSGSQHIGMLLNRDSESYKENQRTPKSIKSMDLGQMLLSQNSISLERFQRFSRLPQACHKQEHLFSICSLTLIPSIAIMWYYFCLSQQNIFRILHILDLPIFKVFDSTFSDLSRLDGQVIIITIIKNRTVLHKQ